MRSYDAGSGAPALLLAHGAGAGQDHPWMVGVARGLAARGVRVVTFDFPYIAAGRRLPDRGPVLERDLSDAWSAFCRDAGRGVPCFAGGKSMGGRIASQVAARHGLDPAPAGLIFFGYPLHPPGKPDVRRDRHLSSTGVPMRFVHGTRDPFGSTAELEDLVRGLERASLQTVPGGDHSLAAPRRTDPDGRALAVALDAAAAWMLDAGRAGSQSPGTAPARTIIDG